MEEREGVGVNLIWAITLLIIVAVLAGAIYYSGILSGASPDKNVDVDVEIPATK